MKWRRRAGRRASTSAAAVSSSAACSCSRCGRLAGLSRHLASGRRRQAPVPVQGASTNTMSKRAPRACQRRRVAGLQHLRVAHAGPLQPLQDRSQPQGVSVVGIDLAGVAHGRGKGQRLAAGACTDIEHLLARARARHQRGDLRALVLHLVPAAPVPDLGLHVGLSARPVRRRQPHADRRQRRRDGSEARQRLQHLLAIGLQRVDAQVDRGATGQRRAFLGGRLAEGAGEGRLQPVGIVAAHRRRRIGRHRARQARQLRFAQRLQRHAATRRRWPSPLRPIVPAPAERRRARWRAGCRHPSGRRASVAGAGRRRPGCRWSRGRRSRRSGGSCPSRRASTPPGGASPAPPRAPRRRP